MSRHSCKISVFGRRCPRSGDNEASCSLRLYIGRTETIRTHDRQSAEWHLLILGHATHNFHCYRLPILQGQYHVVSYRLLERSIQFVKMLNGCWRDKGYAARDN